MRLGWCLTWPSWIALDEAELPADAAVTPLVYAVAGPSAAVGEAQEPFAAALQDAYDQLAAGVPPGDVARGAKERLVGLEALTPERLADLALLELVGGDWVAYPMPVAVFLPGRVGGARGLCRGRARRR